MNIALKPEQEQFVQLQIDRAKLTLRERGRFKSADEAAFQAFKLLEEKYRDYEEWIEDTRKKVDIGIAELERGEGVELDFVIEQLQQKFQSAKENT